MNQNQEIKRLRFMNDIQIDIINEQRAFIEVLKQEFKLPEDIHTRKQYFEVFHKNQKNAEIDKKFFTTKVV